MNNRPELFSLQEVQPGHFLLKGELTFRSAQAALRQVDEAFDAYPRVTFDLGDISRADSAGVGIMLAWLARVRQTGSRLTFVNMPEQLMAIAHVAGVDSLLRSD